MRRKPSCCYSSRGPTRTPGTPGPNQPSRRRPILGRETTVRALLASHADFRAVDNDGANALHTAAYGGHRAIVELLLASGLAADDRASTDGMSSLAYATVRGHPKVMRLLLDRQANANLADSGGNTPLIHAAMRGRTDAVRLLFAQAPRSTPHQVTAGRL